MQNTPTDRSKSVHLSLGPSRTADLRLRRHCIASKLQYCTLAYTPDRVVFQ